MEDCDRDVDFLEDFVDRFLRSDEVKWSSIESANSFIPQLSTTIDLRLKTNTLVASVMRRVIDASLIRVANYLMLSAVVHLGLLRSVGWCELHSQNRAYVTYVQRLQDSPNAT